MANTSPQENRSLGIAFGILPSTIFFLIVALAWLIAAIQEFSLSKFLIWGVLSGLLIYDAVEQKSDLRKTQTNDSLPKQ